ncbi:MAG: FtsQ-type POTRA domain-containing protein, partial [Clostridiales bacterium]
EINVSGNAFVDSQRIIELSGLKKGDNIFAASLAGVESWLRIEPYIKSSVITRKLPNTINIKVEERIPVAVLPTGRGFLFIDDAGRVLSRKTQVADLPLPLIVGVAGLPVGVVAG